LGEIRVLPDSVSVPARLGLLVVRDGGIVDKTYAAIAKAMGITGLLIAGYMFVVSLPDIRRYIRISTM
jgi:hypothetical protein